MNFFRNMRLIYKMGILALSFLLFLSVIGLTSITKVSDVNSKLTELNDERLIPIVKLESLKSDVEYIRSQSNSLLDAGDDDTIKAPIQEDIQERTDEALQKLQEYRLDEQYSDLIANFEAFLSTKDQFIEAHGVGTASELGAVITDPMLADEISDAPADSSTLADTTTNVEPNSVEIQNGGMEEMIKYNDARKTLIDSFDEVISRKLEAARVTFDESEEVYSQTKLILSLLIGVCAVFSLGLSVIITRSIVDPIREVTDKLEEISSSGGDLTQRIGYESEDEIGQLSQNFDRFVDKLQIIIKEVTTTAQNVATSSKQLSEATGLTTNSLEEISKTIVEIATSTTVNAAVIEQTTAALEEMANFSDSTSKASSSTAESGIKARNVAETGADQIGEVVASITDIAASSKEVSVMVGELDSSSQKIGEIIQIITSISEQTNLLALNAAIEAARAGDAGRGFNVVADEIGKLATESKRAAAQISGLIKENQNKSSSVVESVNLVEEKVNTGVEKATEVGLMIREIMRNVQQMVQQIEQIDSANERQAVSTKEMEQAMQSMSTSSGGIAEGTENISAGIQEQLSTMLEIENTTTQLSEMAKRLWEATSGFVV